MTPIGSVEAAGCNDSIHSAVKVPSAAHNSQNECGSKLLKPLSQEYVTPVYMVTTHMDLPQVLEVAKVP